MDFLFVTDPLLVEKGSVAPPILLARELRMKGHSVRILTLTASGDVKAMLEGHGIEVLEVRNKGAFGANLVSLVSLLL